MEETRFVNDPTLNAKWKTRFDFFDRVGGPSAPQYKGELKKLPFKQKMLVNGNFFAFFFGPFYFFYLGVWKKGLAMFAVQVALNVVLEVVGAPGTIARCLSLGFGMFYMSAANYTYYLKRVKGQNGWNPFEGLRF